MRCATCKSFTPNNTEQALSYDLNVVQWMGGPNAVMDGFITMTNCCGRCSNPKATADFQISSVEVPIKHTSECTGPKTYEYKAIDEERNDWHEPEHRARKWHMFGAKATIRVECTTCKARGLFRWEDKVQLRGFQMCPAAEVPNSAAVPAV
jgi:hypothetical protein